MWNVECGMWNVCPVLCGKASKLAATLVFLYAILTLNSFAQSKLRFQASGNEFTFNTGELQGTLRQSGRSFGITPVTHIATGRQIAAPLGLLTPYRLLDAEKRYLPDARGWSSSAELREDGAVQVSWKGDAEHPFDLDIVYRWATPLALDSTVTVTAKKRPES